jgi:hypothetical protein
MRKVLTVVLLMALLIFWLVFLPLKIYAALPVSADLYLKDGSPAALILLFVLIPAGLGLAAFFALATWMGFARLLISRSEMVDLLRQSILGGGAGRVETWLLNAFYGKR